jgi:hypothetical protein
MKLSFLVAINSILVPLILRPFRAALFAALMVMTGQCAAGILDKMAGMFSNKIEVRISVVDERQRPIPHVTLWFMYADKEASEYAVSDMERLLSRYAADYDLMLPGTVKPISAVLIHYTDSKGGNLRTLEENNFRGLTELPIIVGAMKRGYRARAHAQTLSVGSVQEWVIQLQRDESSVFDQRLLELDEIRSLANGVSLAGGAEERASYIDGLNERLVRLAQIFESEGKQSLAAIAYFNLANLPSIDRMAGNDGKVQILGYTRGYDQKSPVRKAYMDKALAIGSDVPLLRCDAIIKKFFEQKGGVWADASKTPMRRQFIADIEACVKSAGGRVFPSTLQVLSQAYSAVGEHARACDTLQRAYRFEPRSYTAKEWPAVFGRVEWAARQKDGNFPTIPGFVCAISAGMQTVDEYSESPVRKAGHEAGRER